jgi:sugar/nucleoside kinase (ribokinase family)
MVTRFLVVGDAILDVTVAPSRPVRFGGDVSAVIRLGAGGQGANVAVRLARRGEAVTLAAPLADDVAGRLLREALSADGVVLAEMPASRTAVVVALLDAGGERSMLSDRQLIDAARVAAVVGGAEWIHLSAYALLDDREGDALAAVLGGRPEGTRLSLAGGSISPEPALVSRFLQRLSVLRPDLLVVSREEAASLLGGPMRLAREAAPALAERAGVVVVTAGSGGSVAARDGALHEVPAPEAGGPTLDSTGAGDAYVAALIAGLVNGPWPPTEEQLRPAMEQGSRSGALVARVVGAQGRIDGEPGPRA